MYKRRNFCGWCHALGHNKRTCPKYRKYVEAHAKSEHGRCGSKNKYWQDIHAKLTGKYLDGTEVKKRPSKPRKCGFCHELGHNSRGCKAQKKQVETLTKLNTRWKKGWSVLLNMGGFGKGSLLKVTKRFTPNTTHLIALGLDFRDVWAGSNSEVTLKVVNPATGQKYTTYFPQGAISAARSQIDLENKEQWHRSFNQMLKGYGQSSVKVSTAVTGVLPIVQEPAVALVKRGRMDKHTIEAIKGRVAYLEQIVCQLARKGL